MNIGKIVLDGNVILAPMAGITDTVFRRICRRMGASAVFSEMISAEALLRDNLYTKRLIKFSVEERPFFMQIFGFDPEKIAAAAQKLSATGVDIIDINMGCPSRRIVRSGAGAALLETPSHIEKIVRKTVNSVSCPVSVKLRVHPNTERIAMICQDNGVSALTLHARTKDQRFSSPPDLKALRRLKELVSIPVIGNGGIKDECSAKNMFKETSCDAIMIGQAAQGNPWIFRRIRYYLETGMMMNKVSIEERLDVFSQYVSTVLLDAPPDFPVIRMRRSIADFLRSFPGAKRCRMRLSDINRAEDILRFIDDMRITVYQS